MRYEKPWISVDDQVELLTKVKGLVCNDPEELKNALRVIGYYRLSAYWFPCKMVNESGEAVFLEGTTFAAVMRSYELDCSLRFLMLEAIAPIEVFLRSRLAYFASKEDGVFGYPESIENRLTREYFAAKRNEQHARHFANKYGDAHKLPPYWMMVECATMGTVEALFSKVSPQVRIEIASELGVRVPVLKNWLSVLRVARNACCHHSRVWNRTWGVRPMIPKAWKDFDAPNDKTFAVLSVLCYMLGKIGGLEQWKAKLDSMLEEFDDIQWEKLGFPAGWRSSTPWL